MLNRNLMLGIFQSVNGNYEKERRNWKTRDTYELNLWALTWQPPCGFFFGGTLSFVITIISFSFRIISFGTIVRSERIGNPEEESHIFSCLLIISSFSSKHYRKSLLVWTSSWEKSHYLEENPWNENWWLMNALKARTLSIFLQLLAKHKKRKGNIGHYIQAYEEMNRQWMEK